MAKKVREPKVYKAVSFTELGATQGLIGGKSLPLALASDLIKRGWAVDGNSNGEKPEAPTVKGKAKAVESIANKAITGLNKKKK